LWWQASGGEETFVGKSNAGISETHQSLVFVFLGFLRYCLEICLDLVGFGWFPLV
jgi:hypothetical protein